MKVQPNANYAYLAHIAHNQDSLLPMDFAIQASIAKKGPKYLIQPMEQQEMFAQQVVFASMVQRELKSVLQELLILTQKERLRLIARPVPQVTIVQEVIHPILLEIVKQDIIVPLAQQLILNKPLLQAHIPLLMLQLQPFVTMELIILSPLNHHVLTVEQVSIVQIKELPMKS